MAAAMVKSVWMSVPRKSHSLVLFPILSPIRPREAPARKVRRGGEGLTIGDAEGEIGLAGREEAGESKGELGEFEEQ